MRDHLTEVEMLRLHGHQRLRLPLAHREQRDERDRRGCASHNCDAFAVQRTRFYTMFYTGLPNTAGSALYYVLYVFLLYYVLIQKILRNFYKYARAARGREVVWFLLPNT